MNVNTGLTPTPITGFNGLYSRGVVDVCPPDHLTDCFNCIFPGKSQIDLREPVTLQSATTGSTVSFAVANLAQGVILLSLASNGNFYDETNSSLLATITGTGGVHPDDFVCLSIFGRAYISFMRLGKALPGGKTYCYYVSASASALVWVAIAGYGPVIGPSLAQVNSGNVDYGVHGIAISFENERGYLSPPSPVTYITSTGINDIEVSSISTGPTGTVARVLLMTLANQTELFLVPGGRIGNNTATTAVINVYDTSLISSADYLNDLETSVAGGTSLSFYKGRLVITGQDGSPDDILVSDVGSPETFNEVNNVIHLPQDFGVNTCSGSMVIRDVLYITKPNGTYYTQDTGSYPSTWPVSITDSGIGAWYNGISVFASSMSGQDVLDSCFIANPRGLMLFDGTYGQQPLTYKIESIWQQIDPSYFYRVTVAHDAWRKRIYIAVPLAPSYDTPTFGQVGSNFMILMGDYQEGLSATAIKWSIWTTGVSSAITKISVENFTLAYTTPTVIYYLAFCCGTNSIYKIVAYPSIPDVGNRVINQIITTGAINGQGISNFSMLDMSISGSGRFGIYIYGKSRSTYLTALVAATVASSATITLPAYDVITVTGTTNITGIVAATLGTKVTLIFLGVLTLVSGNNLKLSGDLITAHYTQISLVSDGTNWIELSRVAGHIMTAYLGFDLSSYTGNTSLQRGINVTDESIFIRLQCDQTIAYGVQGRIVLDKINIYSKKMWNMRPALTQAT
jgi:hypothetical protein